MPNFNDARNWPDVPPDLLRTIEEWACEHGARWRLEMTGDEAIGVLAKSYGMMLVVEKLRLVRKKQLENLEKRNIPSHIRGQ